MKDQKIEIFITNEYGQDSFLLEDTPLMIGTGEACQFRLEGSGPAISIILQKENDGVLIKTLDTNTKIESEGSSHSEIKLQKGGYFKIGSLDFVLSISEKKTRDALPSSLPDLPPDDNLPETPTEVIVSAPVEKEPIQIEQEKVSSAQPAPPEAAPPVEEFVFNIDFIEEDIDRLRPFPLNAVTFNTDLYIDPEDETVIELPSEDIEIESLDNSILITHQHNGVLLGSKYVRLDQKDIYLSNIKENRSTVKIHDCGTSKHKIISNIEGELHVDNLEGYEAFYEFEEQYQKIDDIQILLEAQKPVILKRGLSQIGFEVVPSPNEIRSQGVININEPMLKKVAYTWTVVFIPLLLIFTFANAPREKVEPEKEMVVIYKRKKLPEETPVPKKEPSPSVEEAAIAQAATPAKPVVEKIVKKEVTVKEIVEKQIVKKIQPKKVAEVVKASTAKKAPKRVSKKKVAVKANKAPKKPAKKSYSFSSSKKMNALLGDKDINFKKASLGKVDASYAKGSANSINQNFDTKSFGRTGIRAGSVANGRVNGSALDASTKGLSGKSKSSTAYQIARTKVLGAIDPELIRKIMREYIPQFRYCYQRELAKNDKVAGVFDVSFKINSNGRGVKTTTNAKGFTPAGVNCIKKVISMITFPRPKGGGSVDVKQPMNFYKL